jgi:hypothetical protein
MKHLSIQISAPVASISSLVNRLIQFSGRTLTQVITTPQRMVGKWRLLFNYCPECNSCAPKLHKCDVCQADTKSYFSWNKEIERTWWKRFAEKHKLAV